MLFANFAQKLCKMAYIKDEKYDEQTTAAIAEHYREILKLLGEDPDREGLVKTPERVAKALQFLTHGAQQDGAEILRSAMFKEERNIPNALSSRNITMPRWRLT